MKRAHDAATASEATAHSGRESQHHLTSVDEDLQQHSVHRGQYSGLLLVYVAASRELI